LLALKDAENVRAYLWFTQLSLITIEANDRELCKRFAGVVVRFCVKVIERWSNDPLNGRMIVWHSIRILRDAARILGAEMQKLYDESTRDAKQVLIQITEEHVEAEIQNKKLQELVEFSTNDRGKRQSEWSVLEIDDSD